jgi:hypothetical protein
MTGYYYSDDGKTFTSKIEAILYSEKNNKKIKFHYYDEQWSKYDWTIEPPESIDYYYKEYAQYLRQTYDYVILCYSGGYDSTNILETFHYNNIKLDKIVIVGAFKQDAWTGADMNHNGELYHNAFPYLKTLGYENITQTFDYSEMFTDLKNFSVHELGESWTDVIKGFYSPHNWFWKDLEKNVVPKEWQDKKVAILFGKDKPEIFIENSKIGFKFKDFVVNSYANQLQKVNDIERINFYWQPEYPFILLKQLHILKKNFVNRDKSIEQLVYNLKQPLIYKSPKSKNNYFSLRDTFLFKKKNSEIYDFFIHSMKTMNEKIKLENVKVVTSKFYPIMKYDK